MKRQIKTSLKKLTAVALMLSALSSCGEMEFAPIPDLGTLNQNGTQLSFSKMDTQLGMELAQSAKTNATGGTGLCYKYVAAAIHDHVSPFLYGMHAYMAADQLAAHPRFSEVAVNTDDLGSLPAGAIVVWGQGSSPSGHISIADGRGYEISDHQAQQMRRHYGGASPRVFIPIHIS